MVRLGETHLPFRIGVMTKNMGNLFQDEDEANGGQQALDHAQREEGGDETHPEDTKQNLDHPRDGHRQEESLETAQHGDLGCHDGGQPRSWSADTFVRAA